MPPKGNADLAHAQAANWVLGALRPDNAVGFQLHLRGCPHCQAAVAEFGQLGQMLQHLPPAAEPPPGLEARTIASVLAAAAEDRTEVGTSSSAGLAGIPPASPETGADERPGGRIAKVIRFPRSHGRAGLLAIASAVAAAVIAAVLILPGLGRGLPNGAVAFNLVSPPGSGQAASGTATARPDASGSWDISLTVHHLKNFGDSKWYQCWYVSRDGRQVASAGTFLVPDSGSGTFSMTGAVDPNDFPTMQIRLQLPSGDGAIQGQVVLTGTGKKL